MIITSPNSHPAYYGTLFLAGGITGCPDWQTPASERLLADTELVVFNPRRLEWNMNNSDEESAKQIFWEDQHLKQSETILFWFPEETLCPITLFELGKYLMTDRKIHIGTHLGYQRRLDVIVQSQLIRPDIAVWSSLDELLDAVVDNSAYRRL